VAKQQISQLPKYLRGHSVKRPNQPQYEQPEAALSSNLEARDALSLSKGRVGSFAKNRRVGARVRERRWEIERHQIHKFESGLGIRSLSTFLAPISYILYL
jgi:hypothetical protein